MVLTVNPEGFKFPWAVPVGIPCGIPLDIDVAGLVLAAFVEGSEHVAVVPVTDSGVQREFFVPIRSCCACPIALELRPEHTGRDARFGGIRFAVANVEDRTHFVPIFCFESTGRKLDRFHHVRVGEGEAFLLPRANEERTVHFDVIDVDEVLVKTSSTHVVPAGQLAREIDRGLNEQVFNRTAGRGNARRDFGVDALHGLGALAIGNDLRSVECHTGSQPHVEALDAGGRGGNRAFL